MDTLAVRLTIPPVGFVGDFHSLVTAPSRAHDDKRPALAGLRKETLRIINHSIAAIALCSERYFDSYSSRLQG